MYGFTSAERQVALSRADGAGHYGKVPTKLLLPAAACEIILS